MTLKELANSVVKGFKKLKHGEITISDFLSLSKRRIYAFLGVKLMDFNELIHGQRGELIRQMPKGANVVLSAGCAGAWYFEWFEENYGSVKNI